MNRTPEDLLVGLFALALLPFILSRIVRGVRSGRLPVYRTSIERGDDRRKFAAMLALHALSFLLIALVAADLLLGLGFRDSL